MLQFLFYFSSSATIAVIWRS